MQHETVWVSQSEAVRLLSDTGDAITQQALSLYLKGHPEVVRQVSGRSVRIDWSSLKTSRATRSGRGPAASPLAGPLFVNEPLPAAAAAASAPRDHASSELSARRAQADTQRAESDARTAKIRADEAEGRVINRDEAVSAFMAAGVALVRAFDQGRVLAVDEIRGAADSREALAAMQRYERSVRATLVESLRDLAPDPVPTFAAE